MLNVNNSMLPHSFQRVCAATRHNCLTDTKANTSHSRPLLLAIKCTKQLDEAKVSHRTPEHTFFSTTFTSLFMNPGS